jgi:hypothetical protein
MERGYPRRTAPMCHDISRFVCVNEKKRKNAGQLMSELSLSAVAMLIFGAVVCYGGVAYFLYRAFRKKHK